MLLATKENNYKNNQIYNILLDYGYLLDYRYKENDIIDFLENRTYIVYENCTSMMEVIEKMGKSVDNIDEYIEYLLQNPNYEFIFINGNCIQLFY